MLCKPPSWLLFLLILLSIIFVFGRTSSALLQMLNQRLQKSIYIGLSTHQKIPNPKSFSFSSLQLLEKSPRIMDFHIQKLYVSKHNKRRLNQEQVRLLETSFDANKKLEPELKLHLANRLGVPPRQVAIWYQNKRARWKTQSLELDYSTLQVKLENALSEKRRLEKDVKCLQEELRQAQEMMFAMNTQRENNHQYQYQHQLPFVSCNSTGSSEEGGISSFHEDNVHDHEVLHVDELYACLIGADSSTWS